MLCQKQYVISRKVWCSNTCALVALAACGAARARCCNLFCHLLGGKWRRNWKVTLFMMKAKLSRGSLFFTRMQSRRASGVVLFIGLFIREALFIIPLVRASERRPAGSAISRSGFISHLFPVNFSRENRLSENAPATCRRKQDEFHFCVDLSKRTLLCIHQTQYILWWSDTDNYSIPYFSSSSNEGTYFTFFRK